MANLGKITQLLKVNSPSPAKMFHVEQKIEEPKKVVNLKRRAWLDEDTEQEGSFEIPSIVEKENPKELYKPLKDKGSIDPLNKPLISTPFIDMVDQPHLEKGSIKGVYKPLLISLEDLRGNPLSMILYFFEATKDQEGNKSKRLTMSELTLALGMSRDSARTAARFLMKNGCLNRTDLKIGKHGWSQYSINESLFEDIKNGIYKGSINPFRGPIFSKAQKGSISSSNFLNNITTTDNRKIGLNLPGEWSEIDIEPLKQIRFSKSHLVQIFRAGNLTPEMVQESIYGFAFDLFDNKKIEKYKDPLNVIMGIFRKGEPYNAPSNYESPQDKAIRLELERLKEQQKKREAKEKEIIEYSFKEWVELIPDEEKNKIAHPFTAPSPGFWPALKEFFTRDVWPQKKKIILANT